MVENFIRLLLIEKQSTYPGEAAAKAAASQLPDHLHLSTSAERRSIIEGPNYKLLIDKP